MKSRTHALFVIAIFLQVALSRALIHAQTESRFELEWHVPPGCLDRDAARAAIDSALGAEPSAARAPSVVRVTIREADRERWTADIWLYNAAGSGERSVEGTSCEQVAQASALIVALALSADPASEPLATQPAPDRRPADAPDTTPRLRFALGARALGDFGSLPRPRPDAGFALALALQYQAVRAEFEATAWLPRLAHDGLAADSGGNLFLYTGALRGCIDLLAAVDATFALGPCAGAEAGATLGRGSNLAISHTRQVFWAAGLVGLSVRYLGAAPLWVGLLGELGRPLHRPAWRGEDFGTVFQPKPLIGRIGLGVGWLFP